MGDRKTVGFLVSGIMDEFTKYMCEGIVDVIDEDNDKVNLVVVPVKYIDRDYTGLPDKYEFQYKENSQNILKENMDAVIVAADCIGCLTTRENLIEYISTLPDIPIILIASKIDGYPGVTFDNTTGIIEGLTYLMEELKPHNVCMLTGNEENSDVDDRLYVFKEMMEKYGVELKEESIIQTPLTIECEPEATKLLDLNPDMEAVFCVNDSVALGLYKVMKRRGLEPGRDLYIMGFDNSVTGAMVTPSLSTVDANAVDLGRHVFEMTKKILGGEKLGQETIPTRFILRDSFGGVNSFSDDYEHILDKNYLDVYFDKVFYRYKDIEERDNSALRELFKKVLENVIDYATAGVYDPAKVRLIKNQTDDLFKAGAIRFTDADEITSYIDQLYSRIFHTLKGDDSKERGYSLMESLKKRMIKSLSNYNIENEAELDRILYSMKTLVKDTLNFSYGNDRSYSNIVKSLKSFGIMNAYVYIYDKPIVHLENERFIMPDHVRIKTAMTNGKIIDIPYSKQRISTKHLFDNRYITNESFKMVLMPLYFEDTIYGSVLYDLTEITYKNGEFLINQFATTARIIQILKDNNEIQKQLEENLAIMAENNIALDKLSRNDVLTGILNRRGFYDEAESILAERRENGMSVIVSYVDMNNLKVINDRFGHDDGDFSLRTISEILTRIIGSEGAVGRIGGDEYAFIYYGELSEEGLNVEIRTHFEEFNLYSDKPYNISVSCGYYKIMPGDTISFEDAMDNADQDLYIAKQYKDNRVLKDVMGIN